MLPLKSRPQLHDVKSRTFISGFWTLSQGELLAWTLLVLGLPVLLMAWRPRAASAGGGAELHVEPLGRGASAADGLLNERSRPSLARLDINRASAGELQRLPGIGPVRAQRIVAWRAEHGPFRDVWELANIRGISKAMLERLEPMLTAVP